MGYFDNIYKASPEELPSRARTVLCTCVTEQAVDKTAGLQ